MHIIRLRGPWTYSLLPPSDRIESSRSAPLHVGAFTAPDGLGQELPDDWRGPVRIERRFHRPTGLDARTRVLLTADTSFAGYVQLNGATLARFAAGLHSWEITQQLAPSNQLALEFLVDASRVEPTLRCDVQLRIDSDSETNSSDFN